MRPSMPPGRDRSGSAATTRSARIRPRAPLPAAGTVTTRLWWGAAALAGAGVLVAGILVMLAVRGTTPLCLTGACDAVARGPYARFLGAPLVLWGLVAFGVTAGTAIAGAQSPRRRGDLLPVLVGLVAFGAAFSAYLTWLQVGVLRAVCAWCAASALLWFALAACGSLLAAATP
ncbi:MAG: vitamin K epoxide reductase family protein [Armatimonadota bacterium]|nr:vitamin K epoxide reductase family protein [Armatimonadota bacterium]